MTGPDRMSVAAVAACLAAGVPLFPLTTDRSYLILALILMLGSLGIGVLLRRLGANEGAIRLVQVLPIAVVPWLIPQAGNPVLLYRSTVEYVAAAFAPMDYHPGFAVFCAVLLWLSYILVETLANGLGLAGWAFAPLVLPYTISALAIYAETSPFLFAFPAAGYALLLVTSVRNSVAAPESDGETVRGWRRGMLAAAASSTALALTGMTILSLPLPERSGTGNGPGDSGAVRLGDPSIDLIRNINEGGNETIIRYETSDGGGDYLRLTALSVFDNNGFHLTATELVPLPLPAGQQAVPTATVRTSVEVLDFASEYLPLPWVPVSSTVAGTWRYDPRTLSVIAIGDGRGAATQNLRYQVTSERLPALETMVPQLGEPTAPNDGGLTLSLPGGISPGVYDLARQVTADAGTAGERALALQDFLRSGSFTYSTAVAPGSTLQTLDDFLLASRTGYCEQFAGAMAVMARILGIPSRVAVGFLPGKKVDGIWEVTPRNMHAWTELYFGEAVGWVPFDATPGGAVGNPTASASPSATASASTPTPTATTASASPTAAPADAAGPGGWDGWGAVAWLAGGLCLAGTVAGGPRLARRGVRWRRLRGGRDPQAAVEGAWAEVRAMVRDRGGEWPLGTTRQVAATLAPELDAAASTELNDLALLVERARYSGEPIIPGDLPATVHTLEQAIERRWAAPTAWLQRWWPRTLWPRS